MSSPDNIRPISQRLLWLFGLNAAIGLSIAVILWWFQTKGDSPLLPRYLADSFIHSIAYGGMFGMGMPYLGERLAALRFPWNWTWIVASLALIAAAASLVVQVCLLSFNHLPAERFWPDFGYKTVTVFFIALVIAACVQAYDKLRAQIRATNLQLRTQQLEKERALKLATETRLQLLESRLHPHFLFNTLNSISALIPEDPALAEQTIQRLAVLLRTLLSTSTQSYVPLKDELNLVKDYVEIEKARFRERLTCSIDVAPELESLAVPPMILQPLVENSIKYAVVPRLSGGEIRVSACKRSGHLVLNVWDSGSGFCMDAISPGHSLDNLQARLKTILGNSANLSVCSRDEGTMVTLRLPVRDLETT